MSAARGSEITTLEQSAGKSLEQAETIEAKANIKIASKEFSVDYGDMMLVRKSEEQKFFGTDESLAMRSLDKVGGEHSNQRNESIAQSQTQ